MNGVVSVIIPVGEWEDYVVRAIKSVHSQGSIVGEILLIDNAISRPEIRTSVLAKISDPKLRVVKSKIYRDAARARNIGIDCAHYDFIAVLDSDDEYLQNDEFDKLTDAKLVINNYTCKPYSQTGIQEFVPRLSIIDLIANLGWNAASNYVKES